MLRALAAVLLTIVLGMFVVLADKAKRPLARLARALLGAFAFVLGVGGLALAVTGLTSETWWAAIVGGAILLVAGRLGWALRQRKQRPVLSPADPQHVTPATAPAESRWRQFENGLDWVGRQQARRAHKAIERFLAERDSQSLNQDHRTLMLACEKRVPELIDTCLDRCRNASGRECDAYVDSTLRTLTQIGEEAERARREVREADDRRLETLHRYFESAVDRDAERRLP